MSEGETWGISKRAQRWVVGILAFAALCVLPALYIKSECKPDPSENSLAYDVTVTSETSEAGSGGAQEPPITKFSFSNSFDGLIPTKHRAQTTHYAPKEPFDWWRHFLCEINGADYVLAIFTIVLAVSTILLWQETKRLAKGADDQFGILQAQHAIQNSLAELERPFVVFQISEPAPGFFHGNLAFPPAITMRLTNFGRSAARVTRLRCVYVPTEPDAFPACIDPRTDGGRDIGGGVTVVGFPFEKEIYAKDMPGMDTVRANTQALFQKQKTLWVIGFVRYRDFFKDDYVLGFGFRRDGTSSQFLMEGGEGYNYTRKEKADDIPPPASE